MPGTATNANGATSARTATVQSKGGTNSNENAQAEGDATTADQLAQQLTRSRQRKEAPNGAANVENDLNPNEPADAGGADGNTEAEVDGESEAAPEDQSQADATNVEGQEGQESGGQDQDQEAGDADGPNPDADDDPELSLPREVQDRINKRIGKEVARRKSLEEENAALKAKLSAAAEPAGDDAEALSTPGGGEDGAPARAEARGSAREAQLEQALANARANLRWAKRNPQGGTVTANGKEHAFSAEDAEQIELSATEDVGRLSHELATYRTELTRNHQVLSRAARHFYPELFVKGSPEQRLAEQLRANWPAVKDLPGGELALGDVVKATLARMKERATGGTGTVPANRAPTNVGATGPKPPSARPTKIPTGGGARPGSNRSQGTGSRSQVVDTTGNATSVEELAKSFGTKRAAMARG